MNKITTDVWREISLIQNVNNDVVRAHIELLEDYNKRGIEISPIIHFDVDGTLLIPEFNTDLNDIRLKLENADRITIVNSGNAEANREKLTPYGINEIFDKANDILPQCFERYNGRKKPRFELAIDDVEPIIKEAYSNHIYPQKLIL